MKSRKQAFVLVLTLFICALLLVAVMTFLTRQASRYSLGQLTADAAQARALALSGIAEAHLKLERDLLFPPLSEPIQEQFAWTEPVEDREGNRIGSYHVVLDFRRVEPEKGGVLVLRSTGALGEPDRIRARRTLAAELDLDESRSTYFQLIHWQDFGVP